jgi:hypothetical protein
VEGQPRRQHHLVRDPLTLLITGDIRESMRGGQNNRVNGSCDPKQIENGEAARHLIGPAPERRVSDRLVGSLPPVAPRGADFDCTLMSPGTADGAPSPLPHQAVVRWPIADALNAVHQ